MRRSRGVAVWTQSITDDREGALAVNVIAREQGGERIMVRSAGLTANEAVERALDHLEERLGGSWAMEDWSAG